MMEKENGKHCAVINCFNMEISGFHAERFFQIPKVLNGFGTLVFQLSVARQNLWVARINRNDLKHGDCVCSDHFVSGAPSPLEEVDSVDWAPSINLGPVSSKLPHTIPNTEVIESNRQGISTPQMKGEETTSEPIISKSTCEDIDLPLTQSDCGEITLTGEDLLMCSDVLEISLIKSIIALPGLRWRYVPEESLEDKQSTANANSHVTECDISNLTTEHCHNNDVSTLSGLKPNNVKKKRPIAKQKNLLTDASVRTSSLNKTNHSPDPNGRFYSPDIKASGSNTAMLKHYPSSEVKKRKNCYFKQTKSNYKILQTEHHNLKIKYSALQNRHKYSLYLVHKLRKDLRSSEAEKSNLKKKLDAATESSKEKLEELKMIKELVSIKTAELLKLQEEYKTNLRAELEVEILTKILTFENNLNCSPT